MKGLGTGIKEEERDRVHRKWGGLKEERDRHILSLWTFFVGQIFKPFMNFFLWNGGSNKERRKQVHGSRRPLLCWLNGPKNVVPLYRSWVRARCLGWTMQVCLSYFILAILVRNDILENRAQRAPVYEGNSSILGRSMGQLNNRHTPLCSKKVIEKIL